MSFTERLKEARISVGYTQQQVADAMGITNSTYCGYETGKRQPDVAKIKQLAKILKTSGDFLLETGFAPVSSEEDKTDIPCCHEDYVADILANFEILDNEYKNVVENLIIQLLDIQKKNRQTQTNKK